MKSREFASRYSGTSRSQLSETEPYAGLANLSAEYEDLMPQVLFNLSNMSLRGSSMPPYSVVEHAVAPNWRSVSQSHLDYLNFHVSCVRKRLQLARSTDCAQSQVGAA